MRRLFFRLLAMFATIMIEAFSLIDQSPAVFRLAILLRHLHLELLDSLCLILAPRFLQTPQLLLEIVERRLVVLLPFR